MSADGFDAEAPFGAYAAPAFVEHGCRPALNGRHRVSRYVGREIAARYSKNVRRRLDAEVDGLRFRREPHRNFYDRGMFAKRILPERAWFDPLFADAPADAVFYDAGANTGVFALEAARRLGPGARIVAIEPHAVSAAKLAANLRFDDAPVTLAPVGLADAPGEMTLYVNNQINEGENRFSERVAGAPVATVRVATLAGLMAELGHDRIDLIKLDIEGFEDRVMSPFFENAPPRAWPTRILLEYVHAGEWRQDLLAQLGALGYGETARDHENALYARRRDP